MEGNMALQSGQNKMTVSIILYFVVALFLAKIAWNMIMPFVLGRRLYLTNDERTGGISMAPLVEVLLLVLAFVLSFFAKGTTWLHSPTHVGVGGLAVIVFSYCFFFSAGIFVGWIVQKGKVSKSG